MKIEEYLSLICYHAFSIHLSIAVCEKPTDVWKKVDVLLQLLTDLPPLFPEIVPRQIKPEPVCVPTDTDILKQMLLEAPGATSYQLKKKGFPAKRLSIALDTLLTTGEVEKLNPRGIPKYVVKDQKLGFDTESL